MYLSLIFSHKAAYLLFTLKMSLNKSYRYRTDLSAYQIKLYFLPIDQP